jgi:hypothetical protein
MEWILMEYPNSVRPVAKYQAQPDLSKVQRGLDGLLLLALGLQVEDWVMPWEMSVWVCSR